jgi:WD40 repeat protein
VADNRELAVLPGFGAPIQTICFSPDERLLVVIYMTSNGVELRVWDLDQRKVVSAPPVRGFRNLAFSTDGRLAAIAGADGIEILDLRLGRILKSFSQPAAVAGLAFHPSGHSLAVSYSNSTNVLLLDVATGAS